MRHLRISRVTAGAFGLLTFTQSGAPPARPLI